MVEKKSEEGNEARAALEKLKEKTSSYAKTENISQDFIRSRFLSFLVGPGKAYEETSNANRTFLNGVIYIALISMIVTFAGFFFSMVFAGTGTDVVKKSIGFVANMIINPIVAVIYGSLIIMLVLAIALFIKNISLKRLAERPFVDNFFNCMALTSVVLLVGAIPFHGIYSFLIKTGADIGSGNANSIKLAISYIPLLVYAWQLGLMYLVTKRYLNLKSEHALLALIPAAIPFLQQLYSLLVYLSEYSS